MSASPSRLFYVTSLEPFILFWFFHPNSLLLTPSSIVDRVIDSFGQDRSLSLYANTRRTRTPSTLDRLLSKLTLPPSPFPLLASPSSPSRGNHQDTPCLSILATRVPPTFIRSALSSSATLLLDPKQYTRTVDLIFPTKERLPPIFLRLPLCPMRRITIAPCAWRNSISRIGTFVHVPVATRYWFSLICGVIEGMQMN